MSLATVFIPKEKLKGERRVAAVPATIKRLVQAGFEVSVQKDAGKKAYLSDDAFVQVGASIAESEDAGFRAADIILMVNPPSTSQVKKFRQHASLISFLDSSEDIKIIEALKKQNALAFSMNDVPRISRAQKIDALSSQSNLAGYKAVLLAAVNCPKIFPLLMTAAGTLRPCRVVVLGAGVAGLQAVATARRLGAIVEVSDVRPAVKEQVESLGATYIEVPQSESLETEGGYAKEASKEFLKRQAEVTREHIIEADVVITTALVRGKSAPVLIVKEVVEKMRPGSVIVDLAAEQGGNCELTKCAETVVHEGVTIIGQTNLPSTLSSHASEVYARNVLNVILEQVGSDNTFSWKLDDEIVKAALVIAPQEPIVEAQLPSTNGTGPQVDAAAEQKAEGDKSKEKTEES